MNLLTTFEMNKEQILELANDYLEEEDILAFAKKIYQMGYNEGYDEGWDSRAQSEYTHLLNHEPVR